jgi:hypothetical protein
MKMKKYKYMHTLCNRPAYFVDYDDVCQVCYAHDYVAKLCDTLKQIRDEQKKSFKWRKERGYDDDMTKYGYVKVVIK